MSAPSRVPRIDELRTARLRLRAWNDDDLPAFRALCADPRVMEFFPSTLDAEGADAVAGRIRASFDALGFGLWAIELPGVEPFVGFVGLTYPHLPPPFEPRVEVGWRLARAHWGRGYATEGARAALEVAFGELGVDEVVSMTAPANVRSRHVMEKLGMTRSADDDFEHPRVPEGHALRRHVLYRLARAAHRPAP